jgi:hypothetical protein
MTKFIAAAAMFLIPAFSFASEDQYFIKSQIFVDGNLVSAPNIVTMVGTNGEVFQSSDDTPDKTVLGVTVVGRDPQDNIKLELNFQYVQGERSEALSSKFNVQSGEEAVFYAGKNGNIQLRISATKVPEQPECLGLIEIPWQGCRTDILNDL